MPDLGAAPAFPPEQVGPYRLLERLGEGGMGVVFLAFDAELGRRVALKWLKHAGPETAERLRHEAQLHARVEHPNVCRLYQVGEHQGAPFLVMQLVHGETLDRVAPRLGSVTRLRLMVEIADGVQAAHRQGLIHRDLKPGNFMVEPDEAGGWRPYVMDFGLARDSASASLTAAGTLLGSPAYMAPEQVRGGWVDPRTDVYGLGASLYEVVAGRPPFLGSPSEVLLQVQGEEPPRLRSLVPEAQPDLEIIVACAMAKDPAARYPSAAAFRDDLQRVLDGVPIRARKAGLLLRLRRWMVRNPKVARVGAIALAAVLAIGGYAIAVNRRAAARARLAQEFGQEVERIRSLVRFAHLQPRHDIRSELGEVHRAMEALRLRMARAGSLGTGPGLHALGRGQLALGELDAARTTLQAAWQAGERGPSLDADLGLVLIQDYARRLWELQTVRDPQVKAARLSRLQRESLHPALEHLGRAHPAGSPESRLVYAFATTYTGDPARAREEIRRILDTAPWLYEGLDLLIQVAQQELSLDRSPTVRTGAGGHQAMGEWTRQFLALAPSCPRAYLQEAWRWYLLARDREAADPKEAERAYQEGLRWAELGLTVEPGSPSLLTQRSRHLRVLGELAQASGRDPVPAYLQAKEAAEQSVRAVPDDPAMLRNLANAMGTWSSWKLSRGEDPGPDLDRGIQAADAALRLEGRDAAGLRTRAWLENHRAEARQLRGEDPGPTRRTVADLYEELLGLAPGDMMASSNGGLACALLFEAGLEEGRPEPATLERGLNLFRAGIQRHPGQWTLHSNLAFLLRLKARWSRESGQDAGPALNEGRQAAREAARLAPTASVPALELGGLELEAARWSAHRGATPRPALEAARRAFQAAAELNPKDPEGLIGGAEQCQLQAESGIEPGAARARGTRLARRALALNPRHPAGLAVLGRLLLDQAMQDQGTAARNLAQEAAMHLAEALRRVPAQARTLTPRLRQAESRAR